MTAILDQDFDVVEVEMISATTARLIPPADWQIGAIDLAARPDRDIRRTVIEHLRAAARDRGRRLHVTIDDPAGRRRILVHPDGKVAKLADTTAPGFGPGASEHASATTPSENGGGEDGRLSGLLSRRPRITEFTGPAIQRRGVKAAAAAAVVIAAFALGTTFGNDTATPIASDRPTDTYSGNGPGDLTSGPGVIFAFNYSYYTYPRNAVTALKFWTPEAGSKADEMQVDIDKQAAGKTRHRLDVTATADPLVYDVVLTLTTSDGVDHPYHQQYRLTRGDNGHYAIAKKVNCESTCPTP